MEIKMREVFQLFILLTFKLAFSQRLAVVKKNDSIFEPIQPFSFLVPGNALSVSQTIQIEQFDILIGLDVTEMVYKQKYELIKLLVENFPKLTFFSDDVLKKEFLSLCKVGENIFSQIHDLMTEAYQYKNEEISDTPQNICSETPLQLKGEELDNEYNKLYTRLQLIKGEWTVDDIKNSPDKQTILFEYCSYFNDFSIIYGQRASSIITALEQLSDGHFPEILLGNLLKTCTTAINGNGEIFEVVQCGGTDKGFRCQIIVRQATNLKEYDTMVPIHYQGIGLMGETKEDLIVRTIDLKEYKYLECEKEYTDFHVCTEKGIPVLCRSALEGNDIDLTIKNCNFSKTVPQVITPLPNGGVLIQGDESIKIMNENDRISNKLPFVIYTPKTLKIEAYEEEFIMKPSILLDKTLIVETTLKEEDINNLVSTEKWNEIFNEAEMENYVDIALILLQIILIPVVLVGFCLTLRQGKVLKALGRNKLRRQNTSDNLKANQKYLLKRMKT